MICEFEDLLTISEIIWVEYIKYVYIKIKATQTLF